jgi:tripartite-type tricarboxylate transporter receptor subunit TctC
MLLGEKHDWLTEHKLSILVQYSQTRNAAFPDVPAMVEFAQTPEQKKMLSLFAALTDIDRTVMAPPGVANDRLASLRAAFASMVQAAEFRADVKKRKMELDVLSGEGVEKLIDSSLELSPSLAKLAEQAWTGKK